MPFELPPYLDDLRDPERVHRIIDSGGCTFIALISRGDGTARYLAEFINPTDPNDDDRHRSGLFATLAEAERDALAWMDSYRG